MRVPGYEIAEELLRDDTGALLRARRIADGTPALLRIAASGAETATSGAAGGLEEELELLRELGGDGIPAALELVRSDGHSCLALEDRGGVPLDSMLDALVGDLDAFFIVGIGISQSLAALHERHVVHGNLSPRSILFDGARRKAQLMDLRYSWRHFGEWRVTRTWAHPKTLAYLAPELTGRMNRGADSRSDLYSLGVVLYELLTGVSPFRSDDSLETIHSQIARLPPAPRELDAAIPAPLSQIVMKLLAKSAAERYQSALGLSADLEICQREWQQKGTVSSLRLGERDVSERLLVPQRLYGRESEIAALLAAFERACAEGPMLMLVGGYAGVGKTSLIEELYRPIVRQRGYFTSGKFDQVTRHTPYGAVIQALRALVQQLLTESEERLSAWRTRLSEALGNNGGVIAEVIPEIELIIGPQPPPRPLGPTEAQNRFQLVFQSFLETMARREHPLVVFLDDLQWADPATLELLCYLFSSARSRSLLIVAVFRDNEVEAGHPLEAAVSALEARGVAVERLSLGPLEPGDLTQLVREMVGGAQSEVEPLAVILHEKTAGNPFFALQFLKTLQKEGLLKFDHREGRWSFELEAIRAAEITDNVVELMTRKIARLDAGTRQVLTLGACIGPGFDAATVAEAGGLPLESVRAALKNALSEGLIVHSGGPSRGWVYDFLHDRVQQAAYGSLPVEARAEVHLAVGRLLLLRRSAAGSDDDVFDVVHHLNLGRSLISADDERLELARLNLEAGRKAKASAAYRVAASYFEPGLALLTEADWERSYSLVFDLQLEAAECEYSNGDFELAEAHFRALLERARSELDRARVQSLRIVLCENMSRFSEAVAVAREGLELFSIQLPEELDPKHAALDSELETIRALLGARSIGSLVHLPLLTDESIRLAMRILTGMWASAYLGGEPLLTELISAVIVRLSLSHGNSEESAYGYVTHAITVGPVLGDYEAAYEWGELALAVNEKLGDTKLRAKIHQQFNAHVNLWRRPFESCLPHAREACRSGLETGDFTYAGYGAFTETWAAFPASRDLERFVRDYEPSLVILEQIRMTDLAAAQRMILSWARALRGETASPLSLDRSDFDETSYSESYAENPFFSILFLIAKLHLSVTFESYREARELARRALKLAGAVSGTIWPVLLDFWGSLATTAGYGSDGRQQLPAEVETAQRSLDLLARSCPENFRCQALLLAAERERVGGRILGALDLYEEAIRYARQTGSLQHEALANELCSRYWRRRGSETVAAAYVGEAIRCYGAWGAVAKVRSLEEAYGMRKGAVPESPPPVALDTATVIKAAHAIAVEIEVDGLLEKLMEIAIENAGAQRGVFLQERENELVVVAEGTVDGITVGPPVPFSDRASCSPAVVRYVRNTGQGVLVGEATKEERFAGDPYIAATRPRSILCVPVGYQGRSSGILYLENNLMSDAFSMERIEIVEVVASQAAISLENAGMYAEMRREIERRRQAEEGLRTALIEVERLRKRIEAENVYLQEEIRSERDLNEIVGSSSELRDVLQKVKTVAPTNATVLILGETGTGKELIARAIHDGSPRRSRPLVRVNCGAISASLVESELFGHVKGAFTGAVDRRTGRFGLADGGTLFLDEVSELPPETQVKLLRVLQEGEFEAVGSSKTERVDVRVIAASNRELLDEVRNGRFRADLYYRLNVFPIQVPPLRDRRSDIPELARLFLERYARKMGKEITTVPDELMGSLASYSWPGNVRELQNLIERAVVLSPGPELRCDLPLSAPAASREPREESAPVTPAGSRRATLVDVERSHIRSVLEETRWVISGPQGAAKVLDMHPNTLRSRMEKLGIQRRT